jgi:hypothetical protein
VGYWSTIEVRLHVSVICACLPTLPSLFRRRIPDTSRQNGLVSPEPDVRTAPKPPGERGSDVLPLLKVVSIHEHRVNH